MYILWSFALGMMIFVGAFWGLRVARSPDMVSDAQAEMISSVDKLRSFVWAANEYVKANPFGASVQVLTWSQIKSAPNVSPVVATQNMPSSWKVVGSSAGWVICADAAQQAAMGVAQHLPESSQSIVRQNVSGKDFVVVGETDAAKANQAAALCANN